MTYERGFEEGERQAFEDREIPNKLRRPRPKHLDEEYLKGYLDGYTPRSPGWASDVEADPDLAGEVQAVVWRPAGTWESALRRQLAKPNPMEVHP